MLGDGAECPSLQWCHALYRKTFSKEYGAPSGQAMLVSLSAAVEKFNAECGSECAVVETFGESDLIVVLCSPLMKRVHKYLKSSREINFLDSGGMMDRHNSRVFTVLAASVAGALPLGMIITSSESENMLKEGMRMLKSIMPPDAFYGRGPDKGPQVMMTDDSRSERNALKSSFPGIVLLLCLFHVLQAFWRYVWESKHKVDAKDKESVFLEFKDWCYAESEEDFQQRYIEMLKSPKVAQNALLVNQLRGLCERAPEWALCYRKELLIRGNNTDNYSEITIRMFKDQVLHRVRAYSVVQLFEFFTTRLELYFEKRIAAVLNNRKENYWNCKHFIEPSKIKPLVCLQGSSQNIYVVKNTERGTKYTVDMELEICTCPVGKNGAPCKHQYAVAEKFNLSTSQFLPFEDEEAKATLHQIMTDTPAKPGWYAPLKGGPVTSSGLGTRTDETSTSLEDHSLEGNDILATNDLDCDTPCSGTSESQPASESHARAIELWQSVNLFISKGLQERPDTFASAVVKFASQFNKAVALSENAVLSAMRTFNIDTFGSKSMRRGRYINVNSAAKVRRKYAALGGRKCTQQGRPPKSTFAAEHGYSTFTRAQPAWDRFPPKRKAVPHNLSLRVQHQVSSVSIAKKRVSK